MSQKQRIFIWGRTAPELSNKHLETVCTGGVLEDGSPIRLYPIPFRYLDQDDRFHRYQWISAHISRDTKDRRTESHRIDCDSIEVGQRVPTDDSEWLARRMIVFQQPSWQFDSMDDLATAQETDGVSLGVMTPSEILGVGLHRRTAQDKQNFERKKRILQQNQAQLRMFGELMPPRLKELAFVENRIEVDWVCGAGKRHQMQIMDWEVVELQRREGNAAALEAVRRCLDLSAYAVRFFVGNIKKYPKRFTIVGLWYPKKQNGLLPF